MSSRFPRAYRQQLAATDQRNIERAIGTPTQPNERRYYHDAVDHRALRGIPAIGPGVTGAIPGTRPGHDL